MPLGEGDKERLGGASERAQPGRKKRATTCLFPGPSEAEFAPKGWAGRLGRRGLPHNGTETAPRLRRSQISSDSSSVPAQTVPRREETGPARGNECPRAPNEESKFDEGPRSGTKGAPRAIPPPGRNYALQSPRATAVNAGSLTVNPGRAPQPAVRTLSSSPQLHLLVASNSFPKSVSWGFSLPAPENKNA